MTPDEIRPFENCVPLYDLKVAAGQFSEEQQVENVEWVELPDVFRPQKGYFVVQVFGESMNRRIPNGSWCLFKMNPVGTREGKIVLVQHRELSDGENHGHFTVKRYESSKVLMSDGTWRHSSIVLRPETTLPGYEAIILSKEQSESLRVIAELVAVLG